MTEEQEHRARQMRVREKLAHMSKVTDEMGQWAFITGYATGLITSIWENIPEARELIKHHVGDLS